MSYHLRYPDIDQPVKDATLKMIVGKHWRETDEQQIAAMTEWLETVSKHYGVETPTVKMDSRVPPQNGAYFPAPELTILLPYYTVLTLLHEYRHHLQHTQEELIHRFAYVPPVDEEDPHPYTDTNSIQLDAVEWSCSLFFSVAPRRFRRMVNEGRVLYVTPEML